MPFARSVKGQPSMTPSAARARPIDSVSLHEDARTAPEWLSVDRGRRGWAGPGPVPCRSLERRQKPVANAGARGPVEALAEKPQAIHASRRHEVDPSACARGRRVADDKAASPSDHVQGCQTI